ncbi:MAG TPA: PepSY domain-containing protein [Nitrospira sp.]|nr:PepSY domain-containing protein [Nitrospira sp.]
MDKGLIRRITLTALVVVAGIVIMTEYTGAESNKVEKAASAAVSIDEAVTTARENVSGTVIDAALEQNHDRLIWDVKVVTPEKRVMEIHIDAHTGTVIDVEEEKVRAKRMQRRN